MRIAIPKGRLQQGIDQYLRQHGLAINTNGDRDYLATVTGEHNFRLQARIVKARAVPQLVAMGNFDLGFCGLDLCNESDYEDVHPIFDLGLNPVRIIVAVSEKTPDLLQNPPARPLVIATEYENMAHSFAMKRNLAHIVIQTFGSTEGYAPVDADIVIDCVETGATIAANRLIIVEEIMRSTTWLVANGRALRDPDFCADLGNFKSILDRRIP